MQAIVPASKIFQFLGLFILKMRGSTRTILPDSELQEESHCSCTASPAQAEEGHLWEKKKIHEKNISICSADLQFTYSSDLLNAKHTESRNVRLYPSDLRKFHTRANQSTVNSNSFAISLQVSVRELSATFYQFFFPIFVTGFLHKIMMGN